MLNGIGLNVMFASALLVTIADALIKKTSVSGSFFGALLNPWCLPSVDSISSKFGTIHS